MTWSDSNLDWCGLPHERHGDAPDEDGAGHVPGGSERTSGEVGESLDDELG